jgi:hypothetical protein
MARWHRECALLVLAAVLSAAGRAHAAEPTAEDRERARTLLLDGRAKLKSGDAEAAVKAFRAAHAIMGVPTTGLDLARGLLALGRLLEARTVALEVARMPAAPNEPNAFTKARGEAVKLAEELAGRIPALVIEASGPPEGGARVTVDGAAVPAEALGLPWKVDPGEHVVAAAAAGFRGERRTVRVDEGATVPVRLTLSAEEAPGREIPTWAWVSGGAGVVALGVGIAFAVDYASVRGTVGEDCPGDVCDLRRYDDAAVADLKSRWNRDIGLALGLGGAALAGIGAAVYGIVTAEGPTPPGAGITPWIGPDAAGLTFGRTF